MRNNKKFFHPKSNLHAMQYVGTHDILFSSFIRTLLPFLLAYVRETTCKIGRSTDHSTNTEHFNAGRSNFFNITKTKILNVAKTEYFKAKANIWMSQNMTFLMSQKLNFLTSLKVILFSITQKKYINITKTEVL